MSAFSDAMQSVLKQEEVPAAQVVETLVIALIQDIPDLLPSAYQPIVQGLDAALAPAVKSFLDAQIAKLGQ